MGKSLNGKELGRGISQRKDGRYMGRFTDRFGKTETLYDTSYNGIRKKLRDAQYEDERGKYISTSNMTVDEWFETWMTTFKTNCRNTSLMDYECDYKRVKSKLGHIKLQDISSIMVQNAINSIKTEPCKRATKITLNDMFERAVESNMIHVNPVKRISIKTISNNYIQNERRVLTVDEEKIFLESAKKDKYGNLYELGLETGMRIGELAALTWDDIDFEEDMIYVRHTLACEKTKDNPVLHCVFHDPKTKTGFRKIPMTPTAERCLKRQYDLRQKDHFNKVNPLSENLVFVTRNNTPLEYHVVVNSLRRIMKSINRDHPLFENVTPHALRHTFATRAIENGMRPKTLQKILGHSTLQMTMDLYCHVTNDGLIDEMNRMDCKRKSV